VIQPPLMRLQLPFDFGDMSGEGVDFLRQLRRSIIKVLQSNRVGDVGQHGLIEF
jgi:hypothetical protein